jgi:SAM-dependent methyltransferase
MNRRNTDERVVSDFGREWATFDQTAVPEDELRGIFHSYFELIDWQRLQHGVGFDCGCGSGRWAAFVAPRVKELHCIDPSKEALAVAQRNLASATNIRFHNLGVSDLPFPDATMDFGYSVGVLHHVPDTAKAISDCAAKLKPGAPLLLYLYYAFDNRPVWFIAIFKMADAARRVISKCPFWLKRIVCDCIAALIYWPLSRLARIFPSKNMPLYSYRDKSFYTLRTDALDRFGTRLEQRYTRELIRRMMAAAGLENIEFADHEPYWVAVGTKRGA